MAEVAKGGNGSGANGNGASGGLQKPDLEAAQFHVRAQYIKDLSFESPRAPDTLSGPGENPNLQVNFNVNADGKGNDMYESELKFEARATNKDGVIYHMELVYAGLFQLEGIPENVIHPVLFVNCPTLLFPFVRRIVSDLTREGGFPPLNLDPIDFAALYKQNLDNMKKQKEEAKG